MLTVETIETIAKDQGIKCLLFVIVAVLVIYVSNHSISSTQASKWGTMVA